jgi:hypothetical protein
MDEWRGFDLSKRKEKIRLAFDKAPLTDAQMLPIVIGTPCYFGFGNKPRPREYWEDPKVMVDFQEAMYLSHLTQIHDDMVPYFMPWFGTGVLASAFGCEIKPAAGNGDDPAVTDPVIRRVEDIARLRMPDPQRSGWMPKVIACMEYARRHSDLPVGLTDMNSPLSTASQLCGYENLFIWMYEDPQAVQDLMALISDALIEWVRVQKQIIGVPPDASNGLQGLWAPKAGVWLSDDDLVTLGPEQYAEFVVPHYSRIFQAFGGGIVHFCGKGLHQAENLLQIENIRAVNNSPMGQFDLFCEFVERVGRGKLSVIIQDVAPENISGYYTKLFGKLGDLRGVMIATFVLDNAAMDDNGGSVTVSRDPVKAANELVDVVRACVAKKLSGGQP